MKLLFLAMWASSALAQTGPALRGSITDPSGALVPGALVQLRGPGGEQRRTTTSDGAYNFAPLRAGHYTVRYIAQGFSVTEKRADIARPTVLDVQLTIGTEAQVINVEDEANRVSADAANNGSALILRERELAALSDDPDELASQLQAMAGPGAGPNGGQIYIDGFTGGMLPSKTSIREVRINSNPFSPEYEKPGFGRIEIFTRPGMDTVHGQVFGQYSKEAFNSRSPLLTSAQRPPYKLYFAAGGISGPIVKKKASFGFDFHERKVTEDAFVLATTLDANYNPLTVNQAIITPQHSTTLTPRFDLALNANNTLTVRNQYSRVRNENQGVGAFSLASQAYNAQSMENAFQITENNVVSARFINETRFQFLHANGRAIGDNSTPAINVQGAFLGGGAQIGNTGTTANRWEIANTSGYTRRTHVFRFGGRLRNVDLDSVSVSNFGGTFTFLGGSGLTALERYRRTLLGLAGGGASQFSINAGKPETTAGQLDAGLFLNDDWRVRPNLTISFGARYEAQTNIADHGAVAPRAGIAWGLGKKTVIRGGFGLFFDRISENLTLNARRFDGVTQQSFLLINPAFFPVIPPVSTLAAARQPQNLQVLDRAIVAPRTWQASAGVDRQITKAFRFSTTYLEGRGTHLQRSRIIGTLTSLTESTGFSRTRMLQLTPSVSYRKVMIFGFYALSSGMTDAEGQPADPYRLRDEWGPSTFADVRHRAVIGGSVPLALGFSAAPFLIASSGSPYNLTTGRDTNGDSIAAERPALVDVAAASCTGVDLKYAPGFGCFNLNPAPGTSVRRNAARGPGSVNLNLRVARTWALRGKSDGGPNAAMSGAAAAIHGSGGGPPAGAMMGPPPPGLMNAHAGAPSGDRAYNLTLTVSANNLLNHSNYAAPSGDLSSPYFGQYRSLAGGFGGMGGASATFNRKVDVQLRLAF